MRSTGHEMYASTGYERYASKRHLKERENRVTTVGKKRQVSVAEQPAPATHLAHPEGRAALTHMCQQLCFLSAATVVQERRSLNVDVWHLKGAASAASISGEEVLRGTHSALVFGFRV